MRLPGTKASRDGASVARVAVATDRSPTADAAVAWAAEMADRYSAQLVIVRVLAEPDERARDSLVELANALDLPDAQLEVVVDADPSAGIVRAAEEAKADVLVVGNIGMSGRKEFLLGNVPNRVSHLARCTVVIVNTAAAVEQPRGRFFRR